ncbi:hypothetical protein RDI58_001101 [Solanum bulbocastanum]|uniref:Uncharacterized protein n=1 Tax=Solanum bulbocastanum TaxID=147425 RepID=A0AAN8U2A0_SOLBU
MAHSIEITPIDDQIPLLRQTKKDEIEEGRKVNHLINIKVRVNEMYRDLDNSSIKTCTIFKVNMGLRESNPAAYTPKMVSIGPYHKKNPQLDPMEKYKLLYLQWFLQRNEALDIEICISELEELKEKALKCYDDIEDLGNDSHDFCQMLLLDGCFVVEFIRERCQMCPEQEDEVFNFGGYICHQIFRDLMLLENQLPFFVLNQLHHMTKQDDELQLLLLANDSFIFFVDLPNMIRASFTETEFVNAGNIKHLLHAVHILSCHGQNFVEKPKYDITRQKAMPNATELSEAGVSFVKVGYCYKEDNLGDNTSLFDITFENGLMKIPYFEVFGYTENFLRNLIAYEQQSSDVLPTYFGDYVTFMDHLIDSDKDVSLLRQKGIIENWMGEDKEVASLFNKIENGSVIIPTSITVKNSKKQLNIVKNHGTK